MKGYRVNRTVPFKTYLETLNILLIDSAISQFESYLDIVRLLVESSTTNNTINTFRFLLYERFPTVTEEITTLILFNIKLAKLYQKPYESLSAYYNRAIKLLKRVGTKDRTPSIYLLVAESTLLDTILRVFLTRISDIEVRREATRDIELSNRSLNSIYTLAEEARRTNIELRKLREEEIKANKLIFYQNLTERNISKNQIEVLITSYNSTRVLYRGSYYSFHTNPPKYIDPTPLYQSTEAFLTYLVQNPNEANRGASYQSRERRIKTYTLASKDLLDQLKSNNPWINRSKIWV